MRHTATIIVMIFSMSIISAQETDISHSDRSHIFSIYSGLGRYIERDDVMSPYKYRGLAIPFEISYRRTGTKRRQLFYANFDNTRLISSLPYYDHTWLTHYVKSTNIQIGYSFLTRAFRLVKYNSDLYLGGEVNSLINLRQHAYIKNNEFLMLDQFNSLAFKALLEKRFVNNRRAAFISMNIPLASYVLMGDTYNAYVGKKTDPLMDYNGSMLLYMVKKGDFVSFNKLLYFKTDLSFVQFFNDHVGVECKYSLRYYKFNQYKDINYSKNLQSQLIIGIVGKL